MFSLIEKVSISVAALLIVQLIQQKQRKPLNIANNADGLERLLAELEYKEYAKIINHSGDRIEVVI